MKNKTISFLFLCHLFALPAFAQNVDTAKNSITLQYNHHHFDKQFKDDWHIASIEYTRKAPAGAFIGRLNYANRLQQGGWQAEAETYPALSKKVYAYAGIGYSPNNPVFARWRSGASVFVTVAKTWEAESGLRYLYFNKNLFIATAGVSKYAGAWLLTLRSFASLENSGNNHSYFFMARRYFKNEKDYAWLQAGNGISPDENRNIQWNNQTLSSKSIAGGIQKTFLKKNVAILSAGWSKDEYQTKVYGSQWIGAVGLRRLL